MYNHVRGVVAAKNTAEVVIDVGGVGYALSVPATVAGRLPPVGKEATLLCHLVVREDDLKLYGFLDEDERGMFRMLINLSGIGPSTAVNVVSGISPREFAVAVERQDAAALKRVKGIGEKTAKRMILELKGAKTRLYATVGGADVDPSAPAGGSGKGLGGSVAADAALALQGLGMNEREANDRIARVWPQQPEWTLEELIRAALRG